jgi:hypothetical protein
MLPELIFLHDPKNVERCGKTKKQIELTFSEFLNTGPPGINKGWNSRREN